VTYPDDTIEGSAGEYTITIVTDYSEPKHIGIWCYTIISTGAGKSSQSGAFVIRAPLVPAA
jgi:hypothetical protein